MDLHKLTVVIEANVAKFKKDVNQAKAEVAKATDQMNKDLDKVGAKTDASGVQNFRKAVDGAVKDTKKLLNMKGKPRIETKQYATLQKNLQKARIAQQALTELQKGTEKYVPTKEYESLNRQIEATYKQIQKARAEERQWMNADESRNKERQLERIRRKIAALNDMYHQQTAEQAAMVRGGDYLKPNPAWTRNQAKIDKGALDIGAMEAQATAMEKNGTAWQGTTSVLGRFGKTMSNVIGLFKKGAKGAYDFSKGMRSTYGTGGALSKMFRTLAISARFMIASMIFRGAINAVTGGFKDLYTYGGRTAQSMLQLKNSLYGLRGSLATAFAPILNYITPALIRLISLVTTAMNAVARFFAVLTGAKTYEVAAAGTGGFDDAASSAGKATKAAEKYKKTLMGFDQINKLDDPSSSSGGSGGGGGITTTDATFGLEQNASSKFAEMVKAAWANDGDFEGVGQYIGEKLQLALDSIPWPGIQAKAYKIGKSVATLFNGFNEPETWRSMGTAIGDGLETALNLAYGFIDNFDFKKFGSSVAEGLNSIFTSVDWKKMGDSLATGIKGIADAIGDFLLNIDFYQIAEALKELAAGAVQGALEAIPGLIKGLPNVLFGMIEIGSDIFLGILEGIARAAADLGAWLNDNVVQPFIKWIKNLFGIASPAKTMMEIGGYIIDGLLEGLKNGLGALLDWVSSLPEKIMGLLRDLPGKIKELLGGIGEKIQMKVELVKEGWSNIKSWIGDKVSVGISLFKSGWSNIKSWVGDKVSVGIKLAKSGWSSVKSWFGSALTQKVGFKLPKIGVKWGSKTVLGFKISYPNGFYTYQKGGFPEEGPFMMNRGEIAGKFSNGKGVVANNQQITTGIANAVGPAVYNAVLAAMSQRQDSGTTVVIQNDPDKLFKVIQQKANQFVQSTGQPAFNT